jgi:hypothetical protein
MTYAVIAHYKGTTPEELEANIEANKVEWYDLALDGEIVMNLTPRQVEVLDPRNWGDVTEFSAKEATQGSTAEVPNTSGIFVESETCRQTRAYWKGTYRGRNEMPVEEDGDMWEWRKDFAETVRALETEGAAGAYERRAAKAVLNLVR